ncbi:MAG: ATP-binding cassette domain-containing protein [Rickettsiales bacterium]|jgi:Fe-S cluster assembly ATP-binding protein|nr:ATP-binding cassette domain-containing protein [Rickettsiales bacterium]
MLEIKNLSVNFGDKQLLRDVNLSVARGARHLLRGHNGSGKTTLVMTIGGAPEFEITNGEIIFDGKKINNENTTTRALMGIFTGAQNVPEIPGLTITSFLKHSAAAHHHFDTGRDLSMGEFLQNLESARTRLDIPKEWLNRGINVGFSGGERKKIMLLQLLMIRPKFAILDEPDSGADAATQQLIADIITEMPDTTFLIISHQEKFVQLLSPTEISVLSGGKNMIE